MDKNKFWNLLASPKTKWFLFLLIILVNVLRLALYFVIGNELHILASLDFIVSTIFCLIFVWILLSLTSKSRQSGDFELDSTENFLKFARSILDVSENPVLVTEEKKPGTHIIVYTNENMITATGYAAENLLKRTSDFLFSEEYQKQIAEWKEKESPGGFIELELLNSTGQNLPYEMYTQNVVTGDKPLTMLFFRDIQERKILEARLEEYTTHLEWMVNNKTEALIESENKHRTLMESMDDIIISLDLKGNFTYINPAWDRYIKENKQLFLGQHYSKGMHPDDQKRFDHLYQQAIQEKINISKIEFRHKGMDGNFRTLSGNLSLLSDIDGGVTGSVLVVRDVTDQKKMEEWLAYTERMESVGLLASGLAHDFNNLFQEIIGFTRRIKRNASTSNEVKNDAESVEAIIKRATRFVKQLLSFAASQEKHNEVFDITESIERVTGLIGRSSPDNLTISTDIKSKQKIEGDSGQFDQVFMNLLINARDAMPNGGRILIETSDILAEEYSPTPLNTPGQGRYVIIRVKDNGTGIPEDIQTRIFDPFFTTKKNGKGTGLGLSTVYGIIKNHGGVISVETAEKGGTIFTICMPAKGGTSEMIAQPVDHDLNDEFTILFVDDDTDICTLTAESLQYEGFRVLTAHNGLQALEMFHAFKREIDIIVMDMVMPEMDGVTTAKKIRQINPDTLIIISTGQAFNVDKKNLDKSTTRILEKPYIFEDLTETIENLLRNRKK